MSRTRCSKVQAVCMPQLSSLRAYLNGKDELQIPVCCLSQHPIERGKDLLIVDTCIDMPMYHALWHQAVSTLQPA